MIGIFTRSEEKGTKGIHLQLRFKQVPAKGSSPLGQVPQGQGATDRMGTLPCECYWQIARVGRSPRPSSQHHQKLPWDFPQGQGATPEQSIEVERGTPKVILWNLVHLSGMRNDKEGSPRDYIGYPNQERWANSHSPTEAIVRSYPNLAWQGLVFRWWIVSVHFYYYAISCISLMGNKSTVQGDTCLPGVKMSFGSTLKHTKISYSIPSDILVGESHTLCALLWVYGK